MQRFFQDYKDTSSVQKIVSVLTSQKYEHWNLYSLRWHWSCHLQLVWMPLSWCWSGCQTGAWWSRWGFLAGHGLPGSAAATDPAMLEPMCTCNMSCHYDRMIEHSTHILTHRYVFNRGVGGGHFGCLSLEVEFWRCVVDMSCGFVAAISAEYESVKKVVYTLVP